MKALAVAAEEVQRVERPEPPGRREGQKGVNADEFTGRAVERMGCDRVGADQNSGLGPPQRRLPPDGQAHEPKDVEGRAGDPGKRHRVQWDAEPRSHLGAVPPVTVEKLDDAARLAEQPDALVDSGDVDGIDDPDAAVRSKRVGRPREPFLDDPPETEFDLVAIAKGQPRSFR